MKHRRKYRCCFLMDAYFCYGKLLKALVKDKGGLLNMPKKVTRLIGVMKSKEIRLNKSRKGIGSASSFDDQKERVGVLSRRGRGCFCWVC